jgi:hypothetical protein
MTAQQLLAELQAAYPELVAAWQSLMRSNPEIAERIAQKAADPAFAERIVQMLTELSQQGGGGLPPEAQVPPNAAPIDAPAPPLPQDGMSPPMMAQPPMPMGPPPGMMGPPPMPPAPPPPPPAPPAPERPRKKRREKAPEYELRDLPKDRWGKLALDKWYRRIIDDAEEGRRRWAQRDVRIDEDIMLYNAARTIDRAGGRPLSEARSDVIHISTRPYQFVERLAGLCAASHDKTKYHAPPWADDDETRFAAQALEDWWTYERHCDEDLWFRRGTMGDPQQPLPRTEAALMALMGGLGFRLWFEPGDKQHPTRYEVIPLNRLYPLAHSITHQVNMSLGEARAIYPEIDEYYPIKDEGGPDDKTQVKIIGWTDTYPDGQGGLWHAIAWDAGGEWKSDQGERDRGKWIKEPKRIDYGFSPYQYVIWGGAAYANSANVAEYERYRGMGVLTMLRRTFKLMDLLQSAIATGALKMVDPPKVQYYMPGTRKEDMMAHDTSQGATNYGIVGEQTQPLIFSVAGGPDGQALLSALAMELADFDSPLLRGAGNAESGYDRVQLTSAAGSLHVGPIMDALEQMYQLINSLRAELVIRKGIGDGREIDNLVYSSRGTTGYDADEFIAQAPAQPSPLDFEPNMAQMGVMKYLTPKMVKLNGVRSEVRFERLSLPEQQMLWNMLAQAVSAKLLSAREAMERMGITNPDRNLFRILQEAVVMNPKALDTMVGAAAMGSGNLLFSTAWQAVTMAEAMGGGGGGGAPPPGIPSAANPASVTGGPSGAPPAIATGVPPG